MNNGSAFPYPHIRQCPRTLSVAVTLGLGLFSLGCTDGELKLPDGSQQQSAIPKAAGGHAAVDSSMQPDGRQDAALTVSMAPHLFVEADGTEGAPAPFTDEAGADEFAIGVVKDVVERGGANCLPLELNEVFIGRLPSGRFLAEDKMVVLMECSLPPRNLGLRSQLYQPGTNVVVYLNRDKASNWAVSSIVPITPGSEEYWRQRLQTFADVVLAGESDDPEKRFRELLVLQPNGALEFTLYCAMGIHPHPAARPVIRDLWRERVKQHPVDPEENEAAGALSLTYLMRSLSEGEMLDEIFEHALRQKPGQRGIYIGELRILAGYADADARQRLTAGLRKFLEDSPALETLDSVKDLEMWGDVANTKQALEYIEWLESRDP